MQFVLSNYVFNGHALQARAISGQPVDFGNMKMLNHLGCTDMKMKKRSLITFLFLFHALIACAQVPEMVVRDSTLLKAIDIFLDSVASHGHQSEKFIISAEIGRLEVTTSTQIWLQDTTKRPPLQDRLSFDLSLAGKHGPMTSYNTIPLCKFNYRGREVYMSFRAEYFVEYREKDLQKILRREWRKYRWSSLSMVLLCHVDDKRIQVLGYFHFH